MTSDELTNVPSLLKLNESDLFTFKNISESVTLETNNADIIGFKAEWETVINYLPLKFYKIINSIPDMVLIDTFDKKYAHNPKMCAYDKYGTTNMWRPLMILNKCPTIQDFNFEFIQYYNIEKFSNILSVLISRLQHEVS